MSDARDQIATAAAELRKLIDRIESEAVEALENPSMERLAAFDGHRRVLDTTMTVLRRTLVRRVEREQSKTEPDEEAADPDGPDRRAEQQDDPPAEVAGLDEQLTAWR